MKFTLTKEQIDIQNMVREFACEKVGPIAAQIDKEHRFPLENVKEMAKLGLLGMAYPEELNGMGTDYVSYALAIIELAKKCASTATIMSGTNSLCSGPVYSWGTDEQKRKYLPQLLSGQKLGAFALTEPGAGSDAAGQQTKAELIDDHWVLNGTKVFITSGGYAEIFIVMAMTDKSKGNHGISAFIVEKSDPGFSVGKTEDKMGLSASSTTELILQNCIIPKDRLLGNVGDGFKVAMTTLDGGRIGVAAIATGIAMGAYEETLKYIKTHKKYGKPLSKYQAVQFDIADMYTRIEASRLFVLQAAALKDEGKPYGMQSAMAKLYASETAMYVTTKAVQLHGEEGYTTRYSVERMMRDAKITEIYEGTSEIQRIVIASNAIGK